MTRKFAATLHWSTAVGQFDDVRDLRSYTGILGNCLDTADFPNVPAQVIPVNYLRWIFVTREAEQDEWGVRMWMRLTFGIISMNAVAIQDGLVVMGEVVNENKFQPS